MLHSRKFGGGEPVMTNPLTRSIVPLPDSMNMKHVQASLPLTSWLALGAALLVSPALQNSHGYCMCSPKFALQLRGIYYRQYILWPSDWRRVRGLKRPMTLDNTTQTFPNTDRGSTLLTEHDLYVSTPKLVKTNIPAGFAGQEEEIP